MAHRTRVLLPQYSIVNFAIKVAHQLPNRYVDVRVMVMDSRSGTDQGRDGHLTESSGVGGNRRSQQTVV